MQLIITLNFALSRFTLRCWTLYIICVVICVLKYILRIWSVRKLLIKVQIQTFAHLKSCHYPWFSPSPLRSYDTSSMPSRLIVMKMNGSFHVTFTISHLWYHFLLSSSNDKLHVLVNFKGSNVSNVFKFFPGTSYSIKKD